MRNVSGDAYFLSITDSSANLDYFAVQSFGFLGFVMRFFSLLFETFTKNLWDELII